MTKKETFEKRFAERYADADLSNEEAYYEHANQLMDDYENYEQATKNLLDALDGNDVLVQMLTDACTQEDFDPVVWMVEKRGLDLEEAMKNPDYAAVIAKAQSRYIESQAEERPRRRAAAQPARLSGSHRSLCEGDGTERRREECLCGSDVATGRGHGEGNPSGCSVSVADQRTAIRPADGGASTTKSGTRARVGGRL